MEDDPWDEVVEGIPQLQDPFMQQYFRGREALIAQEKKQRSDYAFRQSLSPTAAEASTIVSRIRDDEREILWTEEEPLNEAPRSTGQARELMESTKLWKIVQKMPKGCLLHAHLEAMVELDWLFEKAMATRGIHIRSDTAIDSVIAREKSPFEFVYSATSAADGPSIWSSNYLGSQSVPIAVAADSFPDGGRPGFLNWLKTRCSFTRTDSLEHPRNLNDIWAKFGSIFPILGSLIFYEPIFRAFVRQLCKQLVDDHVRWVDLRACFVWQYRRTGQEEPEDGYEELMRVLEEEIREFQTTEEGKNFWGARIIWTIPRIFSRREIIESMKQCVEMKLAFPDLIAGFDLVGQEDLGRPLHDLTPELFWFRKLCMEEGVEIPFFFHAGECHGDGDVTDHNLFDAILLGTRRIGHGFSLYKHPLLIDMIKEKKILVESCPISNEVLGLSGSVMSHPLPALLARGVPVALCNDDPAIWGPATSAMTREFWQALQSWENLGLEGLGSLAENSIRWAAFTDETNSDWTRDIKDGIFGKGVRAQRLKEWTAEWERFCLWIVTEFGEDEQEGPEVELE